jgi:hypothetical protein
MGLKLLPVDLLIASFFAATSFRAQGRPGGSRCE